MQTKLRKATIKRLQKDKLRSRRQRRKPAKIKIRLRVI